MRGTSSSAEELPTATSSRGPDCRGGARDPVAGWQTAPISYPQVAGNKGLVATEAACQPPPPRWQAGRQPPPPAPPRRRHEPPKAGLSQTVPFQHCCRGQPIGTTRGGCERFAQQLAQKLSANCPPEGKPWEIVPKGLSWPHQAARDLTDA